MQINQNYSNLKAKINNKTAIVGVIGLGYVGLPLAMELCHKGYTVYGLDINEEKLKQLQKGNSYITGIEDDDVRTVIENKKLIVTKDFSVLSHLDSISICVPTPLSKYQQPDVTFIEATVKQIRKYMKRGVLIILESTSYPGTTEELIEKELEKDDLIVGEDYFLCFSPERVDPGNTNYNIKNTPKVIGGTSQLCTELAICLYTEAVHTLFPVSSPKIAEMSKLLENSFRSINIGFINEMALLSERLNLDIWETIDAASSKPFGFMRFTPGPGIGGHCIPLDPMYLSWKGKEKNFTSRYIDLAQEINVNMPLYTVNKVGEVLNKLAKPIKGSNIFLLGMSYKPNLNDIRESPSIKIFELLKDRGANVLYNDPHVPQISCCNGMEFSSTTLEYGKLKDYDCVILLTDHDAYDYQRIVDYSKQIIDTRNAFKNINSLNIMTLWGRK